MTGADTRTLWSDPLRTRFFLIPDEVELPAGDFLLRTVAGRERRADPAALAPFEVSRDEARVWLKSQLGSAVEGAKSVIADLFGRLRTVAGGAESAAAAAGAAAEDVARRVREVLADMGGLLDGAEERLRGMAAVPGADPGQTAARLEALAASLEQPAAAAAARLRDMARRLREEPRPEADAPQG